MIKNICTLLVLLSTLYSYGQEITLFKNTNPKAKELKHDLNPTKDSIILGCETKILHVEIFNEDYEKIFLVDGFKALISLEDIPEGKFVIETKLTDKIIIFGLMRYSDETADSAMLLESSDIAEGKGMMLDETLKVIKKTPNHSIAFILTGVPTKKHPSKNQRFYWILTKVNSESGSSKTMKLVDKESADRMILKHKIEINSISGKLNELTVWEVYDTAKFMAHQILNPNFSQSLTSDLFNTTPYYTTQNKVANL